MKFNIDLTLSCTKLFLFISFIIDMLHEITTDLAWKIRNGSFHVIPRYDIDYFIETHLSDWITF